MVKSSGKDTAVWSDKNISLILKSKHSKMLSSNVETIAAYFWRYGKKFSLCSFVLMDELFFLVNGKRKPMSLTALQVRYFLSTYCHQKTADVILLDNRSRTQKECQTIVCLRKQTNKLQKKNKNKKNYNPQ